MSIAKLPEFPIDGYQVEPSTAKINELIDAINSGGGGGSVATFPMAEGVWYSPFTIIDGQVNRDMEQLTVDANTAQAAPVRIFEDCTISKIGLDPVTPPSGPVTFRLSLHRHGNSGRSVWRNAGVRWIPAAHPLPDHAPIAGA